MTTIMTTHAQGSVMMGNLPSSYFNGNVLRGVTGASFLIGSMEIQSPVELIPPKVVAQQPIKPYVPPTRPFTEDDAYNPFELYVPVTAQMERQVQLHHFGSHKRAKKLVVRKKRTKKVWQMKFDKDFIVRKIEVSIAGGPSPSMMPEIKRCATATSKRSKLNRSKPAFVHASVDKLIDELLVELQTRKFTMELIGSRKRTCKLNLKRFHSQDRIFVQTKHEAGRVASHVDVNLDSWCEQVVLKCTNKFNKMLRVNGGLTYGSSGLCILSRNMCAPSFRPQRQVFIVRGENHNLLCDARDYLCDDLRYTTKHFSDEQISKEFFLSFCKTYKAGRPEIDHSCERGISVSLCGEVAGLVTQLLFPSGKITCTKCFAESTLKPSVTEDEFALNVDVCCKQISSSYPQFTHVLSFLKELRKPKPQVNPNIDTFAEIKLLVGGRNKAPFTHVLKMNDLLLKGSLMSAEEYGVMTSHLLEVARYLNNRTENMMLGSLASFRNKISAKAHINLTLMCDNQLDRNGNFVWGARGYHAKRFFTNFFDEVKPDEGYDQHVVRKSPNTSRKLAIGNLIMSTNFESLRNQLVGEKITACPLTENCISKRDDNFLYSCCCVTLDDGKPLLSDLKTPTKKHLVVGNSDDAKFIDLPKEVSEGMYIVKEGYCYLNIFLAMLVNVNENDAKDFTKFVRDTLVPKLGKWPKMIDVATACYMLKVLYPDVHNAELPRILVDHEHKTMHVLDSYGSLTTGYHVLKANTVTQLCEFASYSLNSSMKEYLVGGKIPLEQHCDTTLRLLIKSIYRPKLFRELLIDEPYLLALCVCSPTIIVAMYNNGSFEQALSLWLGKDMELCNMVAILTTLAQKVSVAELVTEQNVAISQYAEQMLDSVFHGTKPSHSYGLALHYLTLKAGQHEVDASLRATGYDTISDAAQARMEKNYADLLRMEWDALTSLEKWYSIRSSLKWLKFGRKQLNLRKSTDFGAVYTFSLKQLLAEKLQFPKVVSKTTNGAKECVYRLARFTNKKWWSAVSYCIPDVYKFITVLSAILMLTAVMREVHAYIVQMRNWKAIEAQNKADACEDEIGRIIDAFEFSNGRLPTISEIRSKVNPSDTQLIKYIDHYYQFEETTLQKGRQEFAYMERTIAVITLLVMAFDAERSDCVYKILSKFKGLVVSVDKETTRLESSLDDICDIAENKQMTVDFELNTDDHVIEDLRGISFRAWWDNQINRSNTRPHYRTEGKFIEFTRSTASSVASEISHSETKDWLVRGAVGSGKSTGLPYNLCKRGKVLMLEPTRPLANNVFQQLKAQPFMASPTLRIRGKSSFGSSPITIMTTGFALHYYAHNLAQLQDFDYVIFDECHVNDASGMAFRNLLFEHEFNGRVLKVSATPPGREVEFSTQYPVEIKIEDNLSFQEFVSAQGTQSNADVIRHGNNILVYVASYNEVDSLSKLLVAKNFMVTKADGRTMKESGLEIQTKGTDSKKHFVVATNIIENGVTLDIDVVVDFGMKVTPVLDFDNRAICYHKVEISYGERIQRLGRVGRHKPGVALRIGHTVKGLIDIPEMIATEAAFLCFMYNLPVTTQNVSTSILEKCTLPQAKTMAQFELPYFYTYNLVRHDGSMHPAIYDILKKYKLRDSNTFLNKLAIPHKSIGVWIPSDTYRRTGFHTELENMRIAFLTKEVPDKVHREVWEAVCKYKCDAGIGRLTSHQVSKVAYTLQTDVHSIARTITTINQLMANERMKQSHFEAITSKTTEFSNYSLNSVFTAIRSRYARNHTQQNLEILNRAKDQLLEFSNLAHDRNVDDVLANFGYLEAITFQSSKGVAKFLGLEGQWNKSLITRDALIIGAVAVGGACMLYKWFQSNSKEEITLQGRKNQAHKLRMAKSQAEKMNYVVEGDDAALTHYFGSAYASKGKKKGTVRGMGHKNRKFVNMYGFDPTDFQYVRFVDPLTGRTADESPYTDIAIVQENFGKIRAEYIEDDKLSPQHIVSKPGIKAYYVNDISKKALEVDLTPHLSLKMSDFGNKIMGFPDRESELRQTGAARHISLDKVPEANEGIELEGASLASGVRDYNMISAALCKLTNDSDGVRISTSGIGFGPFIITNKHLFRSNNGQMEIRTQHGLFFIRNLKTLQVHLIENHDMLIIKMPKDFPPFAMKLKFRLPVKEEKACIVSTNFQTKSMSSQVSEPSTIVPIPKSTFWRHWITTKDGQCGLPLVALRDGKILGIHCGSNVLTSNHFTYIPENFQNLIMGALEMDWVKGWKFNLNTISWGNLKIQESQPEQPFVTEKIVSDLFDEGIVIQANMQNWVYNEICDNLVPIATCPSQLVTKHVVKGKCNLFSLYLATHEEEEKYFRPLMGAYLPSKLNREAYLKDIMKYSSATEVGSVNTDIFDRAVNSLINMLEDAGFEENEYVTDEMQIFSALNMKAAVGALYKGKKSDYFANCSPTDLENFLRASCERLFLGKLGLWNGSLKAELRPIEKVEQNKTRTFTAAPVDTLLAGKVCVDDFNNQFYSLNLQIPSTVGMTKFFRGWDKLMRGLPDGWTYCYADGSRFDSSLSPYLLNAIIQVRLYFMEEWDIGEVMLKNLYTEIVYTPISTPDGTVIKKHKGNNSGQPSTVVDNTLMVNIAMFYAMHSRDIPKESVRFYVNGDDLLIAIEPQYEDELKHFQALFLELGLIYTFDDITKDRSDVEFMSHKAILREGIYIPKLEPERIVSILEWDRSGEPSHRLEAICASIIESWGYDELTKRIRMFYLWVLEQAPYKQLAEEGRAPYLAETALRKLYLDAEPTESELLKYAGCIRGDYDDSLASEDIYLQADKVDAGSNTQAGKNQSKEKDTSVVTTGERKDLVAKQDRDVNAGSSGTFSVPRIKAIPTKMNLPKIKNKQVISLDHLLNYKPEQHDISNTRATHQQFEQWHNRVRDAYEVTDEQMQIILNGLMVWCIENGTSPNIHGVWTMMDGEEQVEYALKPIIENAQPTFRQIMAHFSDLAEAYIEMRNRDRAYMPRYGLQRNLTDMSLSRYAFDFYEVTPRTPTRAREAHMQMKAAAIRNNTTKLFGLDGNVSTAEEDTERHTAQDVNRGMHTLLGVRQG
nr:polyprotein [Colombian datura virus]